MARLFARTEYVCEMPSNVVPGTDVQRTFETNRQIFETLLGEGDMLVIPTFGFSDDDDRERYPKPNHKTQLLELVERQEMGLLDQHWKLNEGPTRLELWRNATTLYAVEDYDFHYEPIVIESRSVQPWYVHQTIREREWTIDVWVF